LCQAPKPIGSINWRNPAEATQGPILSRCSRSGNSHRAWCHLQPLP